MFVVFGGQKGYCVFVFLEVKRGTVFLRFWRSKGVLCFCVFGGQKGYLFLLFFVFLFVFGGQHGSKNLKELVGSGVLCYVCFPNVSERPAEAR